MTDARPNDPSGRQLSAERLDAARIDPRHYLTSLIGEGLRTGVLAPEEPEKIQIRLLEVLHQEIREYTCDRSSSVPADKARQILGSLLYALDWHLQQYTSPDEALRHLGDDRMADLIRDSRHSLSKLIDQTGELLQRVRAGRPQVDLLALNELIDAGFDAFFTHYDRRFDACNTLLTLDYPLLSFDRSLTGIRGINACLASLELENHFLACFPAVNLDRLLTACGRPFCLPGRELIVNLAEILLKQSFAAVMLGLPYDECAISEVDGQRLEACLKDLPDEKLAKALADARQAVLSVMGRQHGGKRVVAYILPAARQISREMANAVRKKTLGTFITILTQCN